MTAFVLERPTGSDDTAGVPASRGALRELIAGFGRVVGAALRAGADYQGATSTAARREVLERFARS
jgi:hypothetical protein